MSGATILPPNNVFAESLQQSGMDRLTDKDGKFTLQPLPYNKNFLEPAMTKKLFTFTTPFIMVMP